VHSLYEYYALNQAFKKLWLCLDDDSGEVSDARAPSFMLLPLLLLLPLLVLLPETDLFLSLTFPSAAAAAAHPVLRVRAAGLGVRQLRLLPALHDPGGVRAAR